MARIVIALGGNALLPKDAGGTISAERAAVHETVENLLPVLDENEVVLTHGNGPQVGALLLQQRDSDAPMPLDVLVAETQAQIGYLFQQSLQNHEVDAATVVTQVVVDEDDPAFDDYTKPVGPFYTREEAKEQPFETKRVGDGEKAWRRVVPSPEPQHIVELDTIKHLVENGVLPICVGGGGVPVVADDGLRGVEAVIDKDTASQVLATALGAETLVILTNVEYAYRNYGKPEQEPLEAVTVAEAEELLADGAFREGSMKPKIAACISFIREGGQEAVITTPTHVQDALAGETGTRVTDNG